LFGGGKKKGGERKKVPRIKGGVKGVGDIGPRMRLRKKRGDTYWRDTVTRRGRGAELVRLILALTEETTKEKCLFVERGKKGVTSPGKKKKKVLAGLEENWKKKKKKGEARPMKKKETATESRQFLRVKKAGGEKCAPSGGKSSTFNLGKGIMARKRGKEHPFLNGRRRKLLRKKKKKRIGGAFGKGEKFRGTQSTGVAPKGTGQESFITGKKKEKEEGGSCVTP